MNLMVLVRELYDGLLRMGTSFFAWSIQFIALSCNAGKGMTGLCTVWKSSLLIYLLVFFLSNNEIKKLQATPQITEFKMLSNALNNRDCVSKYKNGNESS